MELSYAYLDMILGRTQSGHHMLHRSRRTQRQDVKRPCRSIDKVNRGSGRAIRMGLGG